MNYKVSILVEVDKNSWNKIITDNTNDLMFKSDYLEAISVGLNLNVKYFIFAQNENIQLASAVFIKGKNIVIADNYTYQPLWIEPSLSERKRNDILLNFIRFLKNSFVKIDLKLNLNFLDVRPFKWEGFIAEPRYTYIRKHNTPIHKTIRARFLRVKEELPIVNVDKPTPSDIDLNIDFLKKLNHTKAEAYRSFLLKLNSLGYLKSFSVKIDGKTVCSFLVLIDSHLKKAYTLMINGANRNQEYIHSLIYKEIMNWLDDNDFETVDFCGANMQGISKFKSFFNPELKLYFIVSYDPFKSKISNIKQIFIESIKKSLIRFNT